jgi:multiple sugar transport system permease protein
VTLFGRSRSQMAIDDGLGMGVAGAGTYDSRQSIIDSIIISLGSTVITMVVAVLAAYALSRMAFKGRNPSSTGCWASASCRPSPSSCRW